MADKETIAFDLDDVLAPTSQCIVDHYAAQVGKILPYGDITAYDYWRSLGVVSDEAAIDIVHSYELAGYPGLEPSIDVPSILRELRDTFRLVLVTARPEKLRSTTEAWLDRYFPGTFSAVIMTGNPYTSENYITKADACVRLGAVCLVDDQLKHCVGAVEVGIDAVLYGNFAWNKQDALPEGVTRCADWQSVREYLNGKD